MAGSSRIEGQRYLSRNDRDAGHCLGKARSLPAERGETIGMETNLIFPTPDLDY